MGSRRTLAWYQGASRRALDELGPSSARTGVVMRSGSCLRSDMEHPLGIAVAQRVALLVAALEGVDEAHRGLHRLVGVVDRPDHVVDAHAVDRVAQRQV